uniref:Uncharacterized protein n=1 Tax=Photinus pyralis TaxID=7054 RepID=A0A1Y1L0K9_PHOPY
MNTSTSINSQDLNMMPAKKFLLLEDSNINVKINFYNKYNFFCTKSNTQCIKLDITFTFGLDLKVDMKLVSSIGTVSQIGDISKMIIWVQDDAIRNEIRSCTNYLQRQKNLNFAISILKNIAVTIEERKLILQMLILHSDGCIQYKNHLDGGVLIVYHTEDKKYFKSHWKIQFICATHSAIDCIDFTVTRKDVLFYKVVKGAMDHLVSPNLPFNVKVQHWWTVMLLILDLTKSNIT